jgi:predicted RNA-binding Zn ribbon-like protein
MGWPATVRYEIDPAPGGLALVQDLLNTAPAGPGGLDLLDRAETALGWWDEARTAWEEATRPTAVELVLTETDLHGLRMFRDALRLLVTRDNSADGGTSDRDRSLPLAAVALRMGDDGQVRVEPRGSGWRAIAAVALIEIMEAQRVDTWRRLKTCREARCRAAFYDRSRNNSKVWHDVHTCGNAVNVRAYRARQRVARSHPSETP